MDTRVETSTIEIRRISEEHPEFAKVLNLIFDQGARQPLGLASDVVKQLLETVRQRSLSVDLLFGAFRQEDLLAACLAVEAPGRSALVFLDSISEPASDREAALIAALRELLKDAAVRRIALLEALVDPKDTVRAAILREAGFHHLTQLVYLRRWVNKPAMIHTTAELDWLSYAPEHDGLFQQALERSYDQTLDCPELTGIRSTAEVLAGHRAAGPFDPVIWWVALRHEQPIGVLLLSLMPEHAAMEVVYLGVAQAARGTGVADALLARAVGSARREGATSLTLAADRRNLPARRLYARWQFIQTGARDAWMATPLRT